MEIHSVRILYESRQDIFTIHPLGDIHAGSIFCVEENIKRQVNIIKGDPFALWWGMGDYCEAITPTDKRWDIKAVAPWVEQQNIAESQRQWVRSLFEPIKDKCLGLLIGNHEETIRLRNYQDIQLDLCRDLGVKNLSYSCFLRIYFERESSNSVFTVTCHLEHGSGAAQTEGGKMMRLVKGMAAFDADIYAMAHLHDIKTNTIPYLYLSQKEPLKIKQRVKVGAITGSWFKAYMESPYPSYAERHGYTPTVIGCPTFTIIPDKEIIKVS